MWVQFILLLLIATSIYGVTVWKVVQSEQPWKVKYAEIVLGALVLCAVFVQQTCSVVKARQDKEQKGKTQGSLELAQSIIDREFPRQQQQSLDLAAELGRSKERIANLSKAIERYRDNNALMKALKETGNTKALLDALVKTVEDVGSGVAQDVNDFVQLNREIATVADLRGEIDVAMSAVKRILTVRPNDITALRDKGDLHQRIGQLDQAQSCFLSSVERAPEKAQKVGAMISLAAFYDSVGKTNEGQETLQSALALARELDNTLLLGACLFNLAGVYHRQGKTQEADRLLDEAMKAMGTQIDEGMKAAFLMNRASFLAEQGRPHDAMELFHKALEVAMPLNDKRLLSGIYTNLANAYSDLGDIGQQEHFINRGLEIDKELKAEEGLAVGYGNLAIIRKEQGKLDEAEVLCRESMRLHKKLGHVAGVARQQATLADIYLKRGDPNTAERALTEALENAKTADDAHLRAQIAINLGCLYVKKEHFEKAKALFDSALGHFQKVGNDYGLAVTSLNLASIAQQMGDIEKTRELLEQSRDAFSRAGVPHMVKLVEAQFQKLARDRDHPASDFATTQVAFVTTHCRILDALVLKLAYKDDPPYDVDLNKSVLSFEDGKSLGIDEFSKEIVALVREEASSAGGDEQPLEELERSARRFVVDVRVAFNRPAAIRTADNKLIPVVDASAVMEIERVFGRFGGMMPFSLDRDSVAVQSSATWQGKGVTVVFKEEDGKRKIGVRGDGLNITQGQQPSSIRDRVTLTIKERK